MQQVSCLKISPNKVRGAEMQKWFSKPKKQVENRARISWQSCGILQHVANTNTFSGTVGFCNVHKLQLWRLDHCKNHDPRILIFVAAKFSLFYYLFSYVVVIHHCLLPIFAKSYNKITLNPVLKQACKKIMQVILSDSDS